MASKTLRPDFSPNIERFTGFAGLYDRHRPGPPAILAGLLANVSGTPRPDLVVDLGCGTGLSTRYWADKAEQVVGFDPTPDMIRQAKAVAGPENVTYREGLSSSTGLPVRCAQVVCCLQALHWMEPASTFAEVARILAPGGVFAACDYDWPPTTSSWEADAAYEAAARVARGRETELELPAGLQQWEKAGHLTRMQASGFFRYVKEVVVHHVDLGNAERLVGLLLSQGFVQGALKAGVPESALGIDALRQTAASSLGDALRPFVWSARVRLGVI